MLSFCGYNFLADKNCVDPFPTNIVGISNTQIQNGIFWHITVDTDLTKAFDPDMPIPDAQNNYWNAFTVLDVDFENNINAGNMGYIASQIDQIKIKRRPLGSFEWTTIKVIDVNVADDLKFAFIDTMLPNNVEYEYAFVPIIGNVENEYIIKQVVSKFRDVYVCDNDMAYKFYANVAYGNSTSNQQIGVYTPFGRRFPVVVSNGILNFESGSITALVVPSDYMQTRQMDREKIQKQTEFLKSFLTNKKPKIIKDRNGNIWLVAITTPPSVSYSSNMQMGVTSISAGWTEIGKYDDKNDLYNAGLIPTKE